MYQFRLYPSKKQEIVLEEQLYLSRFCYNTLLAFKIKTYKEEKKNLSCFDLNNYLVLLKQEYPLLKKVHSQTLQDISKRVSLAFNHFFRRVKYKENPGFPRFKSQHRYHSLTYPQSGFHIKHNKLSLSKLGDISIVQHRNMEGIIKTLIIKKTPTNKWYANFCVEKQRTILPSLHHRSVGIDLGLHHFYATSEGTFVDNPRYLRITENKLIQVSRRHSKKKKGSKNRTKSRFKLARVHEKIVFQRLDFLHKESYKLSRAYQSIAVEDLKIKNMVQNRYLSKSIHDASWNRFIQLLSYKVEDTGGILVKVDPRNTSQTCLCGNNVKKSLNIRIHSCNHCGIIIDRDVMSALIIKQLAFGSTVGSTGSNAWGNVSRETSMNQESLASYS